MCWPCQWMEMGSESALLTTVTQMKSPSVASTAGPGYMLFTRRAFFLFESLISKGAKRGEAVGRR